MKYLQNYLEDNQKKTDKKYGVFFAFNNSQFEEGCKKVGVNKNNKVTRLYSGLYILSKNVNKYLNETEKNTENAIKQDIKENGVKKIVFRELGNHEYQLTQDTENILNVLEGYNFSNEQLTKYINEYMNYCIENNLF
tara:strand:- start:155 stop:565 length:411 start_codon:yes stop_codon:yes gene_type:complete